VRQGEQGIAQKSSTLFFVKAAHLFVVHFPSTRNCSFYPYDTVEGKICLSSMIFFLNCCSIASDFPARGGRPAGIFSLKEKQFV
jgi:hypothetical protein